MTLADQERLDNVTLLEAADPSSMLRQVASAALGSPGRRASSTSSTGMSSRTG